MASAFGLGGGMPMPSPEEIAALQKQAAQGGGGAEIAGDAVRPLAARAPRFPGTLPGLGGGKLPGLGGDGFNPFGEKKK